MLLNGPLFALDIRVRRRKLSRMTNLLLKSKELLILAVAFLCLGCGPSALEKQLAAASKEEAERTQRVAAYKAMWDKAEKDRDEKWEDDGWKNKAIWMHCGFGSKETTKENLLSIKNVMPQQLPQWHKDGFSDLSRMPNIDTISMGGKDSTLTDEDVRGFCEQKLPNLKNFIAPFTENISAESVEMVADAFPSLESISVIECPNISQNECEAIEAKHSNLKITGMWNFLK